MNGPFETIYPGRTYQFTYTNWRGETSVRTVKFEENFAAFGRTEWHNDSIQLFLSGVCQDKHTRRSFCAKDIQWDTFEEVL